MGDEMRGVIGVFSVLIFSLFTSIIFASIIFSQPVSALDQLTGFVNDEAGVISQANIQVLNEALYNLKLNSSVEMAIATVKTTGDVPIEEYSLNLAHKTLGEKGKDNGILILLAVDDRAYRIETGYGIEPILSAAKLGRIGRGVIEPRFKEGNYEQGLIDGTNAIISALNNDSSFETDATSQDTSSIGVFIFIVLIILFFVVIPAVMVSWAKKRIDKKGKKKKDGKDKNDMGDFIAAMVIANMFGRGGSGGGSSGGFGGGSFGGGGFGGGSFGGGGFSGRF